MVTVNLLMTVYVFQSLVKFSMRIVALTGEQGTFLLFDGECDVYYPFL